VKILVIGGGAAGYFAALKYKTVFHNTQVDLIQSKNINIIGVGESSTLDIPLFFFEDCKLDIHEFHNEVTPTFKMGLQTRDWSKKGKIINYTFDSIHLMYKYGLQICDEMDDFNYTLFSSLINQKKPPITKNGQLICGDQKETPYLHAYQIENKKFIPYLKKQAIKKGINLIEGEIHKIEHHDDIIDNVLFNENKHKYDFYVDCSGFNNCITNFIKNDWLSLKDHMPCDSVILGEHPINEAPNHCSVAHAMTNGWMFQIDCYGRTGKGYVYNSSTIKEEHAIEEYMKKTELKVKNFRTIKFKSGHYKKLFGRNYCLVGNCAGFAEPLEATGYTIILNSIHLLIKNHSDKNVNLFLSDSEIKNNNLYLNKLWREVVNVIIMHYKFNDNYHNEFWNYCYNLNFLGDFNYAIEFLMENSFNFFKSKEIDINYLQSIFFPVEAIYYVLKSKDIIKKEKKENSMNNFFLKKSNEIMTYDDLMKEQNYKKYFDNKLTINNFLE
jgi:tryptophan halogenase